MPLPLDIRLLHAGANALLVLALVLAVALLVTWALRSPVFNLRALRLEGDLARNSLATLRANALPRLQGNFFSIDLAAAQAAFEAVPWVRRATVQRVWPDRLAVRLEEHRPAAWWVVDGGDDRLVNTEGEVFDANPGDVEDEDLPLLQGPEGSAAEVLALRRRLEPLLAPLAAGRIERLALSARGSWRAELADGAVLELGRGSAEEVAARTAAFAATVGQLVQRYQRPLEAADLRHAGGYALRLQGIGTLEPGSQNNKPAARD